MILGSIAGLERMALDSTAGAAALAIGLLFNVSPAPSTVTVTADISAGTQLIASEVSQAQDVSAELTNAAATVAASVDQAQSCSVGVTVGAQSIAAEATQAQAEELSEFPLRVGGYSSFESVIVGLASSDVTQLLLRMSGFSAGSYEPVGPYATATLSIAPSSIAAAGSQSVTGTGVAESTGSQTVAATTTQDGEASASAILTTPPQSIASEAAQAQSCSVGVAVGAQSIAAEVSHDQVATVSIVAGIAQIDATSLQAQSCYVSVSPTGIQAIAASVTLVDLIWEATASLVMTGANAVAAAAAQDQSAAADLYNTGAYVLHATARVGPEFYTARMRIRIISDTPIPYGGRPQIQLDVEHPTQAVTFGAERFGEAAAEYAYEYGTAPEVEKLATSYYAEGESYLFTSPPVADGKWEFMARTDFGVTNGIAFRVQLPDNSLLIREPPP